MRLDVTVYWGIFLHSNYFYLLALPTHSSSHRSLKYIAFFLFRETPASELY
jgi:hypothetical protein